MAPAAPPTTSITQTLTQLATNIAGDPTSGFYVYYDAAQAPTGAGVAGSTFLTNAALLAAYEALTTVQQSSTVRTAAEADTTVVGVVEAGIHVFPTTPNMKVRVFGGATIWSATTATAADRVANVADGTILYVSRLGYRTNTNLFYKILDGTYVNDYIKHERIEILSHDSSTGG